MDLLLMGLVIPGFVKGWAAAIATPIAIVAVIVAYLKVDTKRENIRRSAFDLSRRFRENGLTLLDGLLESVAVGDKSGVIKSLFELTALVKEPEVFAAKVAGLFQYQLDKHLADPAKREIIAKALKDRQILEEADTKQKAKVLKLET